MMYSNVKILETVKVGEADFQILSGDLTLSNGACVKGYIDGNFVTTSNNASIRLPRKFQGKANYEIAREIYGASVERA